MSDEITARKITIVDSQGRPKIVLSVDETDGDSDAQLELLDSQGQVRYMLYVDAETGFVGGQVKNPDGTHKEFAHSKQSPA